MTHEDFLNIKIYEPRNLGSVPGHVYLGKSSSIDSQKQTVPAAQSENCFSVFLWASIVGGTNVRVDPATDKDPYTFVDQKWWDLRPYKYWFEWRDAVELAPDQDKLQDYYEDLEPLLDDSVPLTNIMKSRDEFANDIDPIYRIRNLTSDGSVVIDANRGEYWHGSDGGPHGDLSNANPSDELVLKVNEFAAECTGEGICPICDVENDPLRNGRTYILRKLKGVKNIAVYTSDSYTSPVLGTSQEDLSDLLPDCTIKVVYEGSCVKSGGGIESINYGGSDVSNSGGFWIGNTNVASQSGADVFSVGDIQTNSTTHAISGGDSVLTLRALLPIDYDWFKDQSWYTGSNIDTVKIIWKFNSSDGYVKKKGSQELMDELGDFYDIDTTGLSISEFEPLLSDAVDSYTGPAGTYTGIKEIQSAVDTQAVAELVWVTTGNVGGTLDLLVIVNNLYSYKWSTTIAATL